LFSDLKVGPALEPPKFRWWRFLLLLNIVSAEVELMLTEREISAAEGLGPPKAAKKVLTAKKNLKPSNASAK
jgi:hypothetical protein